MPDVSTTLHYAFDAYGTLFDVHAAAARHQQAIGPLWRQLSQVWRAKHLEYTWVHALSQRPATFWDLAQQSLDHASASVGVTIPLGVRQGLLAAYRSMDAYAEVADVIAQLTARGARVAILSNGDPDMLEDAVRAAKLTATFDAVLSVTAAGIFKPAPEVYRLVMQRFGCQAQAISYQSSNRWDIAGAKAFGFRCVWINRTGAPDEYPDLKPDRVVGDLTGLLQDPS
jgi:2-haloacid dehalogenase